MPVGKLIPVSHVVRLASFLGNQSPLAPKLGGRPRHSVCIADHQRATIWEGSYQIVQYQRSGPPFRAPVALSGAGRCAAFAPSEIASDCVSPDAWRVVPSVVKFLGPGLLCFWRRLDQQRERLAEA